MSHKGPHGVTLGASYDSRMCVCVCVHAFRVWVHRLGWTLSPSHKLGWTLSAEAPNS